MSWDIHSWAITDLHKPAKHEIIEVLVYMPAIYKGTNEFNVDEFEFYDGIKQVRYWKLPSDPTIVWYVRKEMKERLINGYEKNE